MHSNTNLAAEIEKIKCQVAHKEKEIAESWQETQMKEEELEILERHVATVKEEIIDLDLKRATLEEDIEGLVQRKLDMYEMLEQEVCFGPTFKSTTPTENQSMADESEFAKPDVPKAKRRTVDQDMEYMNTMQDYSLKK